MSDQPGIWQRIGRLVGATAPVLGGMIAGPAGAQLAGSIAQALGVRNEPSAIEEALRTDPNAAVKLAELETSLERTRIEAQRDERIAIEQTHQAELQQSDLRTKRTRPTIARQSWGAAITYAVLTIFGRMAGMLYNANLEEGEAPIELAMLAFDPVIFGTLAGPALWYMGMRGLEKYKHGGAL